MGGRGSRLIDQKYSMAILCNAYCDVVERGLLPVERPTVKSAPQRTEAPARAGV